jgi:hypothetical protein
MKTRVLLLCLLALCMAGPAFAIVGHVTKKTDDKDVPDAKPVFACTPDGFTLVKGDDGLHLHGQLQVPTGGWTYQFNEDEPGPDGSLHGRLTMQKPSGPATQVISKVAIDHTFSGEGDHLTVKIEGLKDNDQVECKMTDAK